MRDAKRRTRLISLRVNENDYAALRHLSALQGARTLSDLARTILSEWVAKTNALLSGTPDTADLRNRLEELQGELERVAAEVARYSQPGEAVSGSKSTEG